MAVGFSAIVPGLGHLLSTSTFDLLFWTAVLVVVGRALVEDRPRLWLLVGTVALVGLNNKHAVAFCLLGVPAGVALVRETRPVLRSPWSWLGGLVALAMWVPNLVCQLHRAACGAIEARPGMQVSAMRKDALRIALTSSGRWGPTSRLASLGTGVRICRAYRMASARGTS